MNGYTKRRERMERANELIRIIGSEESRLFWCPNSGRVGRFEADHRNVIWWVDEGTGRNVYVGADNHPTWRGFSHSAGLRSFVQDLYHFIRDGTLLLSRRTIALHAGHEATHLSRDITYIDVIREAATIIAARQAAVERAVSFPNPT